MPHIYTVMQDMRGAKAFASIGFTSGYCKLRMHEDSQPLHAFVTLDGVIQPTCTTQGGCNSAVNFQACVEPCFSKLWDHFLALIDDFVHYHSTESSLPKVIDRFL